MSFWKWMQQNAGTGSVMFPSQITPNLVEEAEQSILRGGLPKRIVPSPLTVGTPSIGTRAGNIFGEFMEKEKKKDKKGPKVEVPPKDPTGDGNNEGDWMEFWKGQFDEEREYQKDLYKKGQILKGVKGIQQGMDKWQLGGPMLAAAAGGRIADRWGTMRVPDMVTSPALAPQMTRYSFQDFIRI
jgi:hypothetical protein